jgi:hypothetical protein
MALLPAQVRLADLEKNLPLVASSLNKTSQLADQQRRRIEGQGAEVTAKLNSFTAAATRADQLSAGFEAKVRDSQKRLDELTKRYDTQLTQIARAVNHTAVSDAFPNIDQEAFIQIGDTRFDRVEKRSGEKWVDIYLTQPAGASGVTTGKRLEALVSDLMAAGFTPFFNQISIRGRLGGIIERAGQGPYESSAVLYFRPDFKSSAEQLTAITAKYLSLPQGSPELADSRQMETPRRMRFEVLLKDAKLDAQIFIGAPQLVRCSNSWRRLPWAARELRTKASDINKLRTITGRQWVSNLTTSVSCGREVQI